MRYLPFVLGLAAITISASRAAEPIGERVTEPKQPEATGANMRLFKPAASFHFCVETQTKDSLATAKRSQFKQYVDAEKWVWGQVLDKCAPVIFSDENQGMLYLNYQGNVQRVRDYRDGLLWSARAYVFSAVVGWFGPTE